MAARKGADRLMGLLPVPRGRRHIRQGRLRCQRRMSEWKRGCVGVGCVHCMLLLGWCASVGRCEGERQQRRKRKSGQTVPTGRLDWRQRLATGIGGRHDDLQGTNERHCAAA
jgi:hypothetical protein